MIAGKKILLAASCIAGLQIVAAMKDIPSMRPADIVKLDYIRLTPSEQNSLWFTAMFAGLAGNRNASKQVISKTFPAIKWPVIEQIALEAKQSNKIDDGITRARATAEQSRTAVATPTSIKAPSTAGATPSVTPPAAASTTASVTPSIGKTPPTIEAQAGAQTSVTQPAAQERTDYSFPKDEYEHYMKLIQGIDPKVHAQLRQCEAALGYPCIEEAVDIPSEIEPGSDDTKGHAILILRSIKDLDEQFQKSYLRTFVKLYKNTMPITQEERTRVLDLIKSVAPDLYKIMIAKDPTGQNHILRYDDLGFASSMSFKDGLPIIYVDASSLDEQPKEHNLATIAHELGHYVSGHFFKTNEPTHTYLLSEASKEKAKKGQLPAQETFNLTKTRVEEHEADRREILDFDINIDTAIEAAQKKQRAVEERQQQEPSKETFTRTHPLWADRIKHFESLRTEAELKKAHGQGKTLFDWQKLADDYKKAHNIK